MPTLTHPIFSSAYNFVQQQPVAAVQPLPPTQTVTTPIQTQSPSPPVMAVNPQAPVTAAVPNTNGLTEIADRLLAMDQAAGGPQNIAQNIAAVQSNTSFGPGNPPVRLLTGLQNTLYGNPTQNPTQYNADQLKASATYLRDVATHMTALEAQVATLQQQLAAANAVPTTTNVTVPQAPASGSSINWTTLLVSVGVIAAVGIGAWYVMTHRRKPAGVREEEEEEAPPRVIGGENKRLFPPAPSQKRKK
jgi:hypothetical protein